MSQSGRKGMIVGALIGCVAALANWEGRVGVALSSVIVSAAIGWTIGYYLDKRRKV